MAIPTPPQDVLEFGKSDAYAKFLEKEELQRREREETKARERREQEAAEQRRKEREEAEQLEAEERRVRHLRQVVAFGKQCPWVLASVLAVMFLVTPFIFAAAWDRPDAPPPGMWPEYYAYQMQHGSDFLPRLERDREEWQARTEAASVRELRFKRLVFISISCVVLAGVMFFLAALADEYRQSFLRRVHEKQWDLDQATKRERDERRDRFFEWKEKDNPWEFAITWLMLIWCVVCLVGTVESTTIHWYHGIGMTLVGSLVIGAVIFTMSLIWQFSKRMYWARKYGEIVNWENKVLGFDPPATTA